jgi:hypothetical protein
MFCAVHLRSILSYFSFSQFQNAWIKLNAQTQKMVKEALFQLLDKETEKIVRKAICDLIGEIGATVCVYEDEGPQNHHSLTQEAMEWPELMGYVMQYLTSDKPINIIAGLKILGVLFSYSPKNYSDHQQELAQIFKSSIEVEDVTIKTAAIECFAAYIENADTKQCKAFMPFIPNVLVTAISIALEDEDLVTLYVSIVIPLGF